MLELTSSQKAGTTKETQAPTTKKIKNTRQPNTRPSRSNIAAHHCKAQRYRRRRITRGALSPARGGINNKIKKRSPPMWRPSAQTGLQPRSEHQKGDQTGPQKQPKSVEAIKHLISKKVFLWKRAPCEQACDGKPTSGGPDRQKRATPEQSMD